MSLRPWQRFQALSLHVPSLSLFVDLSKTSLADDALARDPLVSGAFPAAFLAMEALEAGALANPDENRRVGHYWLRAPERAPDAATRSAIETALEQVKAFAADVHEGRIAPETAPRFSNLLVVGIGGSALGPQFVADALGAPSDPLRPFFFDNTDSDGMARELARIASTPVGLLPAALQGLDVDGLLAGAAACDEATRVPNVAKNPAAMLALAWYRETGGRGQKDMVVLPYRDRLLLFSRYLQQLVMESLGKEKDLAGNVVHQGIAVYGNKGSTDQHAYVQQLREGVPNFFVTFVEVARDGETAAASLAVEPDVTSGDYLHGFLLGTRKALYENGRGSITLTMSDVSARSVGMLIALYERTVGLYAQLVGVNAYHQPGVEAGKKAAAAVLVLQASLLADLRRENGVFRTAERIAASAGAPDETETVFKVLEHLAANPDHGVARKAGPTFFLATFGIP